MDALTRLETTTTQRTNGQVVVRVVGEVDMATAPQLAAALESAVWAPCATEVVLDLAGLRFIDATGLRVLVKAYHLAEAVCRPLWARNSTGEVDCVLRLTGVDTLLHLPEVPVAVPHLDELE